MSDMQIIEEKPLTLAELKEKIHMIEKRDKELTMRCNKTKDYVEKVIKLNKEKSEELIEKIKKLEIPRIKDRQIIKIVDLLPKDMDELKSLFVGEVTTINQENMKKILDVVKEYV